MVTQIPRRHHHGEIRGLVGVEKHRNTRIGRGCEVGGENITLKEKFMPSSQASQLGVLLAI